MRHLILMIVIAAITFSTLTLAAAAARRPMPHNFGRQHVTRIHADPHNFLRAPALAS